MKKIELELDELLANELELLTKESNSSIQRIIIYILKKEMIINNHISQEEYDAIHKIYNNLKERIAEQNKKRSD